MSVVYAPLSQNDTEGSDSEKELFRSVPHRIPQPTKEVILPKKGKPSVRKYNVLHIDGEPVGGTEKIEFPPEPLSDVEIQKRRLSPARRCCLLISILILAAVLATFIWAPLGKWLCKEKYRSKQSEHREWEVALPGIMPSTDVVMVPGHFPLMIFGYRGINTSRTDGHMLDEQPGLSGVICLNGAHGTVVWRTQLFAIPTHIKCLFPNGCIVSGKNGLFVKIDVFLGEKLWGVHSHNKEANIDNVGSPELIPDMNDDGISDLVYVSPNDIVFVSGGTGEVLRPPIPYNTPCPATGTLMVQPPVLAVVCDGVEYRSDLNILYNSKGGGINFEKVVQRPKSVDEDMTVSNGDVIMKIKNPDTSNTWGELKLLSNKGKMIYTQQLTAHLASRPTAFNVTTRDRKSCRAFVLKLWSFASSGRRRWSSRQKRGFTDDDYSYKYPRYNHSRLRHNEESTTVKAAIMHPVHVSSHKNHMGVYPTSMVEVTILLLTDGYNVHNVTLKTISVTRLCTGSDTPCEPTNNIHTTSELVMFEGWGPSLFIFTPTFSAANPDVSSHSDTSWHLTTYVNKVQLRYDISM